MKYKPIEKFLTTLLCSWGSDAPPESVWAANDFLKIIEEHYSYKFENEFTESFEDNFPSNNSEAVLLELKTLT